MRHRAKLVGIRRNCKAQVHGVLLKCGIQVLMTELVDVAGTELLDRAAIAEAERGADRVAAPDHHHSRFRERRVRRQGTEPGWPATLGSSQSRPCP